MQCAIWCPASALFVALAIAPLGLTFGQDSSGYVEHVDDGYMGDTHVGEGYVGEGYVGEGCVGEGCVGEGGGCVGNGRVGGAYGGHPYGVHSPCAGKANYWYRPYTERSQADLFYNYYVPNSYGSPAAAYPAPFPTPSLVGHTYYTYQPLMPHEWLYEHHRSYHQYYNNGMGLNRTIVKWQGRPVLRTVKGVRNIFRLPR